MIPAWMYVVSMAAYVAILVLLTETARRSIWFGLGLNVSLFAMLFFSGNIEGWFRWAKVLSVLIPMFVVHAGRIASKRGGTDRLSRFLTGLPTLGFLCAILCLNILEASVKDFTLGNWANGACGLVMIACVPFTLGKSWRFDVKGRHVLVADLSLAWCFLYTTWNACFVYAESPAYFAASCCILLVPEIFNVVSVRKGEGNLWLHARIYTLMIHVALRAFRDVFTPYMDATAWQNESVKAVWGIVNLGLMAAYAVWWFAGIARARKSVRTGAQSAA